MVKKVFPLLLSYVFLTTQSWAISGGPNYGALGTVSTTGTYSGVITGLTESTLGASQPSIPGDPVGTPPDATTSVNSNALGLFDLAVPSTGTASGAFLLFADGFVFGGTIDASVDPDNANLQGIVQGSYTFTVETTIDIFGDVFTTGVVAAQALGRINAKIRPDRNKNGNTAARLTGTANLDINFGQLNPTTLAPIVDRTITFTVSGFKQSTAVSTTSTIGTASGSGAGASAGG